MADDIWEYYMRDLNRAAEFMTDRVQRLAIEVAQWKAVAQRFYDLDPSDQQAYLYACVAYEDLIKGRDND